MATTPKQELHELVDRLDDEQARRLAEALRGVGPVGVAPPPRPLAEADIQVWLDRRRPGQSRFVTQRQEPDAVKILSGVFEGVTTGTPISLLIENVDQRSRDYGEIKDQFRPAHADYTYWKKYGVRDYRGGGRQSARETAVRVAAGAIARKILGSEVKVPYPRSQIDSAPQLTGDVPAEAEEIRLFEHYSLRRTIEGSEAQKSQGEMELKKLAS